MGIGVGQALARKFDPPQLIEAMVDQVEIGMLAGVDEARLKSALGKSGGDGGQFDSFGPGADDQPDLSGTQPSP
jgi:hypothetical protein